MTAPARTQVSPKQPPDALEELQDTLLNLQDDLSETIAWTALLCDGLCGIVAEHGSGIDPATQSGMRFAAIWLKKRNDAHTAALQAACRRLREIRGQ